MICKIPLYLLALWAFSGPLAEAAEDYLLQDSSNDEALRQCGNVLNINIHDLQNPHASFENDHCFLKCFDGNKTLAARPINEGFPCPTNPAGTICQNGLCLNTGNLEAAAWCGVRHNATFEPKHSKGTEFTNERCAMRCVLGGVQLSKNNVNEGRYCGNNGTCHAGQCVKIENTTVPTPNATYSIESIDVVFVGASVVNKAIVSKQPEVKASIVVSKNHYRQRCDTDKGSKQGNRFTYGTPCTMNFHGNYSPELDFQLILWADKAFSTTQNLYQLFLRHFDSTAVAAKQSWGKMKFNKTVSMYDDSNGNLQATFDLQFAITYLLA